MKKRETVKSNHDLRFLHSPSVHLNWLLSFTLCISLAILLTLPHQSYAQGTRARIVTGIVRNASDNPLQDVTVILKGTTIATTTDAAGRFSINVPSSRSVLEFSYVGMGTTERAVGNNSSLNVILEQDAGNLQDVVVVGYGTRKKATLTGSVSVVDAKAFQDRGPVANPISALQGTVPGVIVTRSSAAPGREGWNIEIRGATSTNGTEPLFIVDGIPLVSSNALNSINPDDIESMNILKDASTAIYGARAAGGVVLITTKRAKTGKPTIEYSASVSRKVIGLQPNLLNVQQFGQGLMESTTNDYFGVAPTNYIWYRMGLLQTNAPDSGYIDLNVLYNVDPVTGKITYVGTPAVPTSNPINPGFGDVKDLTFFNTNWLDILWGNTTSTQHNLSLSGRNANSGYRLSFGYMHDGSLLQWGKNSNSRYNVRLANDFTFFEKLKIETNLSLEKNDIVQPQQIGSVTGQFQQPGFPAATKLGQPYGWGTQYSPTWLAELGGEQNEYNTRVFTNLKLTYSFSKHFRFIGQAGYNWAGTDIKTQSKAITNWSNYAGYQKASPDNPTQVNTFYQRQFSKDPYYNLNGYVEYQNTFKGNHEVSATLGSNYERDEFNSYTARTSNIGNDNVPSLNLGIGDAATKTVNESQRHYAIGSYFGRFNYGYKGKYLLEALARYDGSSRFIAANRWKLFYGVSGGYRISQENFMKNISFINDLKIRASWGSSGNQNGIGLYDYIQLLNTSSNTTGATNSNFPIIGNGTIVYVGPTNSLVSLDRTWETVEKTNLAVDFSLLKSRLSGSFEYFIKHNVNMLLGQTYPAVLGASAPSSNIGHLKTWGWETSIMWRDKIGDFSYRLGGALTDNKNILLSYGGANVIGAGLNNNVEGYPLGSYFGLKYAGRIQDAKTANDINGMNAGQNISMPIKVVNSSGVVTAPGVQAGDNMYADVNGDGKFTIPGDLIFLGREDPRYSYSINLGADWKGFDFTAIFQGVGERTIFRGGTWRTPFGSIFQGQTDFWWGNTWRPDRTDAYYPTLHANQNATNYNTYNYQISDWSVENGAYIRLKNLVLGYTLPQQLLKRANIQKLRLYFSGNDLWEKSHIRDKWDPEAGSNVTNLGGFPFYRYLTAGVNVTF